MASQYSPLDEFPTRETATPVSTIETSRANRAHKERIDFDLLSRDRIGSITAKFCSQDHNGSNNFNNRFEPSLNGSDLSHIMAQLPSLDVDALQELSSMDAIVASMGPQHPRPPRTLTNTDRIRVAKYYHASYVAGLISFFECQWFNIRVRNPNSNTGTAVIAFANDDLLNTLLANAIDFLENTDEEDQHVKNVLDARVIWNLASMVHTVPVGRFPVNARQLLLEARHRVMLVCALLRGQGHDSTTTFKVEPDDPRINEYMFWNALQEFLRVGGSPPANNSTRHTALGAMIRHVDERQNRRLLLSVALIRYNVDTNDDLSTNVNWARDFFPRTLNEPLTMENRVFRRFCEIATYACAQFTPPAHGQQTAAVASVQAVDTNRPAGMTFLDDNHTAVIDPELKNQP